MKVSGGSAGIGDMGIMRLRILWVVALLMMAAQAFGQDIIHTTEERAIQARVIEIGEETLRYKLFVNPQGPDYVMDLSRVDWIEFENGTIWEASTAGEVEGLPVDVIGPIDYSWGRFYARRGNGYDEDYIDYNLYDIYGSDFLNAMTRYNWGEWLTVAGASALLTNLIFGFIGSSVSVYGLTVSSDSGFDVFSTLIGVGCLGAGIPLWISGNRRLSGIADDYNRNYAGRRYGSAAPATLEFGPTSNGIGLALRF